MLECGQMRCLLCDVVKLRVAEGGVQLNLSGVGQILVGFKVDAGTFLNEFATSFRWHLLGCLLRR